MTTIVFDGLTLAADSQQSNGNTKMFASKLILLETRKGYVAVTGHLSDARRFINWMNGKNPTADIQYGENFTAYHCYEENGKGVCDRYLEDLTPYRVTGKTADGSGRDLALGAMAMGATAATAVYVASLHDCYTGGPIEAYTPGASSPYWKIDRCPLP